MVRSRSRLRAGSGATSGNTGAPVGGPSSLPAFAMCRSVIARDPRAECAAPAVAAVENSAARRQPLRASDVRSAGSRTRQRPAAIESMSSGSTYTASSPAISRSGGMSEQTTGAPCAIASSTGMPKPSKRTQCTTAEHVRSRRIFSSSPTHAAGGPTKRSGGTSGERAVASSCAAAMAVRFLRGRSSPSTRNGPALGRVFRRRLVAAAVAAVRHEVHAPDRRRSSRRRAA